MKSSKLNGLSSLPRENGYVVYIEQYNKLWDDVFGGTGTLSAVSLTLTGDLTVAGTSTFNGTIVLGDAAADSLTVNATTTYTDPINFSNQTGISALGNIDVATAVALTEEINNVTTVGAATNGVKLPAAVAGKHVYIKNSGANKLYVFPATGDTIDALAATLSVQIQPSSSAHFYAKDASVWESSIDASLTLAAPTTLSGSLEFLAANSAGNFVTTVTNASQAAARTYTIPDAGATTASFVMTEGAQSINGVKTFGDATSSTSKDTGGLITQGGVGIEKELFTGTTINAGTAITVGTDITGAKEVDHVLTVATTTTAATVGGKQTVRGGTGATSGAGGAVDIIGGTAGATAGATGGAVNVTSGVSGAGTGPSGAVNVKSAAATDASTGIVTVASGVPVTTGDSGNIVIGSGAGAATGNTGTVGLSSGAATTGNSGILTITSGNATTGDSGDVNISTGTASVTTGVVNLKTGGTTQWVVNASGMLNPATDNAHDIGNATVNPRDIYITRGIKGISANFGVRGIANATCTLETYTDGKDVVSIITLTNFIVGAIPGAGALAVGNKIFSFPAGYHVHSHIYSNVGFTIPNTGQTPVWGIGSVIGSGAVLVLNGTATFMDYITEQTAPDSAGTADPTLLPATAGLMTGISLNLAGSVKDVFLNAAETWAADNAGDLTASGTITIKWTIM